MGNLIKTEGLNEGGLEELKEQAEAAASILGGMPKDKAIQAAYYRGAAIGYLTGIRLCATVLEDVEDSGLKFYRECRKIYFGLGAPPTEDEKQ